MNEKEGRPTARRGSRRFKVVLAIVVVAILVWSGIWFAAATVFERQLDKAMAAATDAGTMVTCRDRRIDGFPFRLELRCAAGSRVISPDLDATVGGVTGVALVYDPRRVILEAGSPARLEAPVPATAEWALAHASLVLSASGAEEMRLEIEEAVLASDALPDTVTADLAGLYVRPLPDEPSVLDLGVKFDGLAAVRDAVPLDVRGRFLVDGAGPLLAGRPDALAGRLANGGVPVRIDQLLLTAGEALVSLGGTVTVRPDGLLDGKVDVAVALPDGGLPDVGLLPVETRQAVGGVVRNVLAMAPETKIGDRPARKLTLTIRSGRVTAGFVPLGRIPPVIAVAGG